MNQKKFKKLNLFSNYSYRKNIIPNNQQMNILKTYNNINNEIIINIKNNEKYNPNQEKKYEVRRIRIKIPNELIHKKEKFDLINVNLRDSNNCRNNNSNIKIIPNSVKYNENLQNKKMKLEEIINDFSTRYRFDSSNNINNTFQYSEKNSNNINYNIDNNIITKNQKKISQIPINKISTRCYKKPLYAFGKKVYHKINNLSYRSKKKSANNLSNENLKLEEVKQFDVCSGNNQKNNIIYRNTERKNNTNYKIPKSILTNIQPQFKNKQIKQLRISEDLEGKITPINVNRQRRFYSNNITKTNEEELNNDNKINDNIINNSCIIKNRNSFNRKSFRFLVSQTNKNLDLSNSFSKCYSNSKKKSLLSPGKILNNNDSYYYSVTGNDTESNNESTYYNNCNEINKNRQNKYNTNTYSDYKNIDKENQILIFDEINKEKSSKIIPRKKYILNAFNTQKYNLLKGEQRKKISVLLSSSKLNSCLDNQPRNISAISLSGINLELYYYQEKIKIIKDKIRDYQKCSKECYNFLKYFFEHNFYDELLKPIKDSENIKKMANYIKLEILCYFLCYNISLGNNFKITGILIKSIFDILFDNFILYLCLIVSQCENETDNIIIVLNKIIKDNLNKNNLNNYNIDENKYINIISNNSKNIIDYYNIIINNIFINNIKSKETNIIKFPECIFNIKENEIDEEKYNLYIPLFFIEINKSISKLSIDFFKKFFDSVLCFNQNNIENKNKKDLDNNNYKNKKYFLPEIKDNKEYSLILDLDDTIIYSQRNFNFKNILSNINKKIIIFRPYLLEFLQEMKPLFELILFSSNTPDNVDPIVDLIQKDQKYFDYILYRQHITLDNDGYNVKNLELIGRDLKKVIIIDDIARYFKLQKENGINIKPFCGNAKKDGNTLKILGNVLKKIRKDVENTGDIRISLNKFRNSLFPDVIVDKMEMN